MAEEQEDRNIVEFELADGTNWRLVGWRGIWRWFKQLDDAYLWCAEGGISDPSGMVGRLRSHLANLSAELQNGEATHLPPNAMGEQIAHYMRQPFAPFHQDSDRGRLVIDILDVAGKNAAAFAQGMLKGHLSYGNIASTEHFRGALYASDPGLIDVSGSGARLSAERTKFRAAARNLESEVREVEASRSLEWNTLIATTKSAALRWAQRRARRLLRRTREWKDLNQTAVTRIEGVEKSYREFMNLQAPVEYWQRKAETHRTAEKAAMKRLQVYFPWAFLLTIGLFGSSACFVLWVSTGFHPTSVPYAPIPKTAPPSGLYFIVSAGLASAAAILFWVGRLLTKLYLSEHHLRHDAEERAVMTTTYLALTAEKAAEETDRQIILGALFRTTADGIVKDDGGFDPNIASVVAKGLAAPR